MKQDPKNPKSSPQPVEGTNEDLHLTNNDTSLVNNENDHQEDITGAISQKSGEAGNDHRMHQSLRGDENEPEYGEETDQTFEAL